MEGFTRMNKSNQETMGAAWGKKRFVYDDFALAKPGLLLRNLI